MQWVWIEGSTDTQRMTPNGSIDLIDSYIDTPTDTPAGLRTGVVVGTPPPPSPTPKSNHLHMCVFRRLVERIASRRSSALRRLVERRSSERVALVSRSSACQLVERVASVEQARRSVERIASVGLDSMGLDRWFDRHTQRSIDLIDPPSVHQPEQSRAHRRGEYSTKVLVSAQER
jgi:hypothetical protein